MTDIDRAKQLLHCENLTCAAVLGERVYRSADRWIAPILTPVNADPNSFRGMSVADRVIGKSAALLLVYSGAAAVYGDVMSDPAADVLRSNGVPFDCSQRVPYIINRDGTGQCPMENAVMATDDPAASAELLSAALAALRGSSNRA